MLIFIIVLTHTVQIFGQKLTLNNPNLPNLSRTRYQLQTPDKSNSSLVDKASPKLYSKYLAASIAPILAKENQSNAKLVHGVEDL
jgi:hypothetical protein